MSGALAAVKLLQTLGEAALKPKLLKGVWRKPPISARYAARLRKDTLLSQKEWPFEQPQTNAKPFGQRRPPKGHKHDKLAAQKQQDIEKNMKDMAKTLAAYRASRQLKETSQIDTLLLSRKQRLMKQFRESK